MAANYRGKPWEPNPDYGTGEFRRAVRVTRRPGEIHGELEDCVHAMRCTIAHDGERITAITPEFFRLPLSSCSGAGEPLQELVGMPLDMTMSHYFEGGRAFANCTHLFDLGWYMIAHARRAEAVRHYEAIIPDHPPDRETVARLLRNGETVLELTMLDQEVVAPPPFAGRDLQRGFVKWASSALPPEEREAALVMQKAFFVSRMRYFDIPKIVGPVAPEDAANRGTCWTYNQPDFETIRRLYSYRDFPGGEGLLGFRPNQA